MFSGSTSCGLYISAYQHFLAEAGSRSYLGSGIGRHVGRLDAIRPAFEAEAAAAADADSLTNVALRTSSGIRALCPRESNALPVDLLRFLNMASEDLTVNM